MFDFQKKQKEMEETKNKKKEELIKNV